MRSKVLFAIFLFLSFSATSYAAGASPTPEENLIRSVFMLTAQGYSVQDLRTQVRAELGRYDETAPREGRLERIGQALVAMKIDTPGQAQAFEAQAEAAAARLAGGKFTTSADAKTALQAELAQLMAGSQGAQFSVDCGNELIFGTILTVTLGASIWEFQKTDSDVLKAFVAFVGLDSLFGLIGTISNQPNACY